jgi:hypothetical protein
MIDYTEEQKWTRCVARLPVKEKLEWRLVVKKPDKYTSGYTERLRGLGEESLKELFVRRSLRQLEHEDVGLERLFLEE